MANPAPIISQINAFNATEGTIISFNIVGGTSIVRSNIIYIYDLSDNSLICTHLYISTESIHELPANTDPSIAYASGKSSADFTNGKQYYAQIQTFTNTAGTEGASGASIAKLFWCLVDPTLTINTIPSSISTTSYNVGAVYNSNTTATSNIVQQYQFNLYSATGVLVQSSGVITGSGAQQGTSTAYDLSYNFTGLNVGSSYYVTAEVTTTQGMTVSAQSSTFTVSIDTPTLGEATVVNNACDGYISVTSNLSGEYGGSASGSIATFETTSVNEMSSLVVDIEPQQSLNGYDHPWVGGAGKNKLDRATEEDGYIYSDGNVIQDGGYSVHSALIKVAQGSYVFSGKVATSSTSGNKRIHGYDAEGNWVRQLAYRAAASGASYAIPFEVTDDITYIKTSYYRADTDCQVEQGTTATSWTPYENLCPISGWDSVEASVTGVNVWDEELEVGWIDGNGVNSSDYSDRMRSKNYISVVPNTAYYFYTPVGNLRRVCYYDASKAFISLVNGVSSGTTPTNAAFMRFVVDSSYGTTYHNDISINYPSTDHEYHAYNGHTHTATFEETVYGGTVDLVSGVLTVEWLTVPGTAWTQYNASNGYKAYRADTPQAKVGGSGMSNMINEYGSFSSSAMTKNIIQLPDNTGRAYMALKEDVSASDVQFIYELATPQTYTFAPQTINTLVGVNNVWADSGDVSVTYNIPITNLLVKRQDTADISGKWLTLYSQPITQASDMDFTFIDFLNQYGKTYKYALVPLLTQEQSGVEVEVEGGYTVSDEVVSIFDGVFVADNTAIYKLKAGVNYGDLSKVQEVGSINTIGSQYPIIVSNSKVDYRTASLSATIVADDYYNNGNLNRMDMVQKRELMESFFTNKRAKILKDWNGNIWLVVFIDNINITFINEYGMGIATLTATWTEIGDVTSEEDLQNTRIINVG